MTVFGPYRGVVDTVHDGDTVNVRLDVGFDLAVYARVRVFGVNAPELATPEGKAARDFVRGLLPPGAQVLVVSHGWGQVRRTGRRLPVVAVRHLLWLRRERRRRRVQAWIICFKRPWNARAAYAAAVVATNGLGEYRCPCGRCELPVFGSRLKPGGMIEGPRRTNPSQRLHG